MTAAHIMFFHFLNSAQYINIKQKYLIKKMEFIVEIIRDARKRRKRALSDIQRLFQEVNQHFAYQCAEIRGYNSFWSIHLTSQFGCCVVCIGYLTYSFTFIQADFDAKVYFGFFLVQLNSLMLFIIYRCANIDENNKKFCKRNMDICVLLQLHYRMPVEQLAKVWPKFA